MFFRLKLRAFVQAHPPRNGNEPATKALCDAYSGLLPQALLQLWRKHGLGFYGSQQLCLIDPGLWQPVLDRWIVSAPDAVKRIPVAVTPFGAIVYYRKLTEIDDEVAVLDPITRSSMVLSWDLEDFFNSYLCRADGVEALIPSAMLDAAQREVGQLQLGENYEADPVSLAAQMLKFERVDARAMSMRLRDAVDSATVARATPPVALTIAEALPADFRPQFEAATRQGAGDEPHVGLYFSSGFESHRLLALMADGTYHLLFWTSDPRTRGYPTTRSYQGDYAVSRSEDGDRVIRLNIELRQHGSLGSDADDEALYVMHSDGQCYLLQARALEDMATAIGWEGRLDPRDEMLTKVQLSHIIRDEASAHALAPAWDDMPMALRNLVHRKPLRAVITQVSPLETKDGDSLMVRVDLGTNDGLRMNMPLCSPAGDAKQLQGWVWALDEKSCQVGIAIRHDTKSNALVLPEIGDVLVSRRA